MSGGAAGPAVRAAGGVVTRQRDGQREFLLVHRPRYDDWSLPKGKLDAGEQFSTAAQREIKEETGSDTHRLARLGSVAYHSTNGGLKLVRYWLYEHVSGRFRPNSEVDEIRWLQTAQAARLLSYGRDRNVLEWGATLVDGPRAGRVHLVRHAKAGTRSQWDRADELRPLTDEGRRQAALVCERLTSVPVNLILSSPHTRCVETVAPLARALEEPIHGASFLAEGAPPEGLLRAFHDLEGKAAVMCGHGGEIGGALDRLSASGARLDPPPDGMPAKGGIWELELVNGKVTDGRYAPPPD